MIPEEMTDQEYCEQILKGKVVDENGFLVCKYRYHKGVKRTVSLERIKEERPLE